MAVGIAFTVTVAVAMPFLFVTSGSSRFPALTSYQASSEIVAANSRCYRPYTTRRHITQLCRASGTDREGAGNRSHTRRYRLRVNHHSGRRIGGATRIGDGMVGIASGSQSADQEAAAGSIGCYITRVAGQRPAAG